MKQAHILLDETIQTNYALLPGDPTRLDHIKQYLDNVQELAYNREFRSLSGYYKGVKVLAISTGIGGASASIAIEELKNIGIDTMIRIGSCGALQSFIQIGDLVIAEGAIRDDGASKAYVDAIYPATPDFNLLSTIVDSCKELMVPFHLGIVHSHESFYIDQNSDIEKRWSQKGVLGADLETAALLTVGRLRNIRCASILNNVVVYGHDTAESITQYVDGENASILGEKREILVALETLYRLEQQQ
ncbi:MAG: nucleoside phosphorylase [Erysipelothrix sp.]|nr:nucleoside phosphorylase [Erysipelothrix sp.]